MSAPDPESDQTKFITHTIKHISSHVQKSLLYELIDRLDIFPFGEDNSTHIFIVKIPLKKHDYVLNQDEFYEGRLDLDLNNIVLAFKNTSAPKTAHTHTITDPEKIHTYFSQVAHKGKDQHEDNYGVLNIGFTFKYSNKEVQFNYFEFTINPTENIKTKFCDWSVLSMIKFFLFNANKDDNISNAYSHFKRISSNESIYSRNNISNVNLFSLGQRMNLQYTYLIVETCIMYHININDIDRNGKIRVMSNYNTTPEFFFERIQEFFLSLTKYYDKIAEFNQEYKDKCKDLFKTINDISRDKSLKPNYKNEILEINRTELKKIQNVFENMFRDKGILSELQNKYMNIFPIIDKFQKINNNKIFEEEKFKKDKKIYIEDTFGWKKYGTYLSSEEYIKYVFIDNDYDNFNDTINITKKFFYQFEKPPQK